MANHLHRAGLPTTLTGIAARLPPAPALMTLIRQDKKVTGGALTFVLTRGIGKAFIQPGVDGVLVEAFLKEKLE